MATPARDPACYSAVRARRRALPLSVSYTTPRDTTPKPTLPLVRSNRVHSTQPLPIFAPELSSLNHTDVEQRGAVIAILDPLHDVAHAIAGLDYPHDHWWIALVVLLGLFLAPAGLAWLLLRRIVSALRLLRWSGATLDRPGTALEPYLLRHSSRLQVRLALLSVLTLPAAWLLLDIPKHIINHALAAGDGHGGMTFLGWHLGKTELLFALCASYLGVLSASGLVKYAANRVRGRVNERTVRRLRLAIVRRTRGERDPTVRAALAAMAVQEVEPIGYFAGGLLVVPLIQGGTLLTSLAFLLAQNAALALSALIMLPVQVVLLPRLQRRLNASTRERVHATRVLTGLLTHDHGPTDGGTPARRAARQAAELERLRIAIAELKGRTKGLYNYTSNLTPFFFFSIGGYLVVQGRLSLGALIAALTAYKEITPALRELFDFAQAWSDARARFEEVTRALAPSARLPQATRLAGGMAAE